MKPPASIVDPASAVENAPYLIAFLDDDWDHWDGIAEASTYIGRRRAGRWFFAADIEAAEGDWCYGDDEIVILEVR